MAKDQEILESWERDYKSAVNEWSPYLKEASIDTEYVLGNQWSNRDKQYLRQENREAYVFNEISRVVKQVSGHQRRNRLQSVSSPMESQDQLTSDIITDCLGYVMRKRNGYNVISDAFEHGALVSGMNLISLWMDFSKDPVNGDVCIDREPYNAFLIDPTTTKLDLSDCGFITRRKYVSKATAKMLLPSKASAIEELQPSGRGDDKYQYMSYSRNNSFGEKLLRYDEYWKRTTRKAHMVIDTISGENQVFRGKRSELTAFMKEFPHIQSKIIFEPSVDLNIIIEGVVMFSGKDQYGLNDYPFIPVMGNYTPEHYDYSYKLQGIVRKLRDSQEELNKMRSKASDIIKSQINSGWEIEKGQVTNPDDLYKTGQGVVIEREVGTAPLKRIQPPELSQAFPLMIADLQRNVVELSGGSQELFGVAESGSGQISGTLAKQRAGNALTAFNSLFDNLSMSQKIMSEKIVKMILSNWTPEKIMKVTGKELPEGIEINADEIVKYDINVQEGLETDSQKQTAYYQALEAKNMGIPIPDSFIIEMLPISNKSDLQDAFELEAQQAQAQAEAAQQQQQALDARQRELDETTQQLAQAESIHKLSLGEQERKSAVANSALAVQRLASSAEDISKAKLNNLELFQEIQGMRQDQIIQAMEFIQNITKQEQAENMGIVEGQNANINAALASDLQPQQAQVDINPETQSVESVDLTLEQPEV